MGSLSFSEIVVIVLLILIVFGPRRLPELARRAGELAKKLRSASSALTETLGVEYEATIEPLRTAKREIDGIKTDITKSVTSIGNQPEPDARGAEEAPADDEPREETSGTP